MSDEGGSTTHAPPPSHGRAGNSTNNGGGGLSIVSSSQLSPKSPAPDEQSRTVLVSEHNSWGDPGDERIDRRRRSTVTFGGATSVAPSSSISKRGPRTSRGTQGMSGAGTQYTRRRSAPWQDLEYRSAKAGSSHGGTAWTGSGAPLTERNVEVLNEKRPPRSERSAERAVERDVAVTELQLDPKVSKKSRRDSGVATSAPQTDARSLNAEARRTSRRYVQARDESGSGLAERSTALKRSGSQSRAHFQPHFVDEASFLGSDSHDLEAKNRRRHRKFRERRDGYESEEGEMLRKSASSRSYEDGRRSGEQKRVVVTTRWRTEEEEDDDSNRDVETKSNARYESYRRPTKSSISKVSGRRQSRAADVYAQSAGRRQSRPSVGRWNSQSRTAFTQRSPPPTLPAESDENVRSSRPLAVIPVDATPGSRAGGRSRVAADTNAAGYKEYSRRTKVKSERFSSQREADPEQKSTATSTRQSARRSTAPSEPREAAGAAATASPNEPSQSPQSAGPPSVPGPMAESVEPQWERRVHIVETRQPDGRLIQDREYFMRRIWPQVGA